MYIEDLTDYLYSGRFPLPGVRAVGWLSAVHTFPMKDPALPLVEKLSWLAAMKPVNQTRGFHRCEFCSEVDVPIVVEGVERGLGSAEIWIPCNGEWFAAPDLVVHYVRDHHYAPPEEFVGAVGNLDLSTWDPRRDIALELRRQVLQRR